MGASSIFSFTLINTKNKAITALTPEQRPSTPSVKLTPLSVPSITKIENGILSIPKFKSIPFLKFPVKGIRISFLISLE